MARREQLEIGQLTAEDLIITDDITIGDDATVTGDLAITGDISADAASFASIEGQIEIPLTSAVPTAPATGCIIFFHDGNLKAITTSGKLATLNNAAFSS